jgi:hypothetical protein
MIPRLLFWSALAIGLLGAVFLAGLHSGATKNDAFKMVRDLRTKGRVAVTTVMKEAPILVRARPDWHLQPARRAGSGVTINETRDDDLVLLSGFFDDAISLVLIFRPPAARRSVPSLAPATNAESAAPGSPSAS